MANEMVEKKEGAAAPKSKVVKKAAKAEAVPKDVSSGGLETVLLRNNFYRDNYRRLMVLCLLLLVVIGGMVGFMYYMYMTRPTPTYFATTHDGQLIEMVPLNKPNLSTNALVQWSAEAATAAYSFNFVNYREALQEVRSYFTPRGYQNLIAALRDSRNLEAVRTKKLVSSAVPTGSPLILKEGVLNGRYTWQVQMPMKVSYQSSSEVIYQDIIVSMLITRVPTLDSPKGIGIAQFIVREGKPRQ